MRVLVSLAVHEQPAVVVGQLRNLIRYLDDPLIVLHISREFDVREQDFAISDRVVINPVRHSTVWGSGILAFVHLQNVRYALNRHECNYVVFHSSNDLFVREGVESYMEGHAAGGRTNTVDGWSWESACRSDHPLKRFMQQHQLTRALHGQLEGSYYRSDVFEDMLEKMDTLEQHVSLMRLSRHSLMRRKVPMLFRNPHYPREEVYFPMALAACGLRPDTGPYTYMNWNHGLDLSQVTIDAVRRRNYSALPDYVLAGSDELFAVKRVPRRLDDSLRQYIIALNNED